MPRINWCGIEWGEYGNNTPKTYQYYFYWWNWLPKHLRSWGLERIWHDGPHVLFGFWFINWTWSTHWSRGPFGYNIGDDEKDDKNSS